MKQLAMVAAVAAFLMTAPVRAQRPAPVFPFPIETVTLENGLRAYLVKSGAAGQVAYVTVVRTGSRDVVETGKTGNLHDRTLFALRAARYELARLREQGMTPGAVAASKQFLRD